MRVSVALEGDSLVLHLISPQLVDETKGMLVGGPSLSEELLQERRKADRW